MSPHLLLAATAAALIACACAPVPGSIAAIRHRTVNGVDVVDEIVRLDTRRGVSQSYLLATEGGVQPEAVAIVFPGGPGVVELPADVKQLRRGPYLASRTYDVFRDREVAVAIVDAPSDRRAGMDDAFRSGREHARDVAAVLRDLRGRFPRARLFLLGTSRGTVSVAHLARELGSQLAGVIMASTVFAGSGRYPGLGDFDFSAIPVPLLFVHHAQDRCPLCPYGAARALSRSYPLVTVMGGRPAESDPCGPLSEHGYYGKEAETVAAMKSWMLGRPFPRVVN